jgi:hypothetical protein
MTAGFTDSYCEQPFTTPYRATLRLLAIRRFTDTYRRSGLNFEAQVLVVDPLQSLWFMTLYLTLYTSLMALRSPILV